MNVAFEEMNRYPIFRGMVRLSESHISRVEEVESDRAACEAAERRKKEIKDAGWHVLWDAFQSAKENAALQNEQVRWPVFLSQNKHLEPPNSELNGAESVAAEFDKLPRPGLPLEDD